MIFRNLQDSIDSDWCFALWKQLLSQENVPEPVPEVSFFKALVKYDNYQDIKNDLLIILFFS